MMARPAPFIPIAKLSSPRQRIWHGRHAIRPGHQALVKYWRASPGWPRLYGVRKVKGHQDATIASLAGSTRMHALGNIVADAAAGRGLMAHPQHTDAENAEAALLLRVATAAKHLFASLSDEWPRIGGLAALPRLPYLPRPR